VGVQLDAIEIRRLPTIDIRCRNREPQYDLSADALGGESGDRRWEIRERYERRPLLPASSHEEKCGAATHKEQGARVHRM
jgi:hypothetical protein